MPPAAIPPAVDAARLFHALSDVIRLSVVEMLLDGECCVCDMTDALDVSQSRLSWHLKTLVEAGLIVGRKSGRWVYYALDIRRIGDARTYLSALESPPRAAPRHRRRSCD